MKNDFLLKHLASVDLSFLKEVKDEVIEEKKQTDLRKANDDLLNNKQNVKNDNERYLYTIKKELPQKWSKDIDELETYFTGIELPTHPVKLNKCSTITNCSLFIITHFAT